MAVKFFQKTSLDAVKKEASMIHAFDNEGTLCISAIKLLSPISGNVLRCTLLVILLCPSTNDSACRGGGGGGECCHSMG